MVWLNNVNGADIVERRYFEDCLIRFHKKLIGVVMGSAYGGSLEEMGKAWKDRGFVYGYDVFEATHPKHLAVNVTDQEATCMEHWYQKDVYGTAGLSYDYQRGQLDSQGLFNVTLVKGEVKTNSCRDLPYIDYAFLDMDILQSMDNGYKAVKDKIVKGGYLLLHDVTGNFVSLAKWYNDIKESGEWDVVEEVPASLIVVLKKRGKPRTKRTRATKDK